MPHGSFRVPNKTRVRRETPKQEWEGLKSAFHNKIGFYDYTCNQSAQILLYYGDIIVVI